MYTKINPGIVYSIFQKLFNYPKINILQGYNKLVIQIFAKVNTFIKNS